MPESSETETANAKENRSEHMGRLSDFSPVSPQQIIEIRCIDRCIGIGSKRALIELNNPVPLLAGRKRQHAQQQDRDTDKGTDHHRPARTAFPDKCQNHIDHSERSQHQSLGFDKYG